MTASNRQPGPHAGWRTELDDLLRGIAGAFLFGAPFLYTMEVWWKGNFASPSHLLLLLLLAYTSLVVLQKAAGFRSEEMHTWPRMLTDSIEALAIALVTASLSLLLIGVIKPGDGFEAIIGRIVMEAVPFSIGVGIANHFLRQAQEEPGDEEQADDSEEHQWHDHSWLGTLGDAGATVLGAVIISSSIAPTDEIPMIVSHLNYPRLLALVAVSLVLSYLIVFVACFGSQRARLAQPGILQSPISETLVSYLISLLMSLLMLYLFQLLRPGDPLSQWVSYTVVLGLPATIGGAAGRIAL